MYRRALAAVVHWRRSAVGIDVVDVTRSSACIRKGGAHRLDRAVAVGRRIGDAIRRKRVAIARELGIDVRAAAPRRFPLLENDEARALTQYKAVSCCIERAAGTLRGVIVGGHRREQAESGQPHRTDHRIESARQRIVDTASADQLERGADGLTAGCAGGVHRRRVAADSEAPREKREPRGRLAAAEHHRVRRGRVAKQTFGMELTVGRRMAVHGVEVFVGDAHHSGADRAAPAFRGLRGGGDARIDYCLLGSTERESMRSVGELEKLLVRRQRAVGKALHLGGDASGKSTRVEKADPRGAAAAFEHRGPGRRDVVTDRSDQAQPRDRDAAFRCSHTCPFAANSTRAVATVFPSTLALKEMRNGSAWSSASAALISTI